MRGARFATCEPGPFLCAATSAGRLPLECFQVGKSNRVGERSPIGIHAVLQKASCGISDMGTLQIHNFVYLEYTKSWEIVYLEYTKLEFRTCEAWACAGESGCGVRACAGERSSVTCAALRVALRRASATCKSLHVGLCADFYMLRRWICARSLSIMPAELAAGRTPAPPGSQIPSTRRLRRQNIFKIPPRCCG